LSNGASRTLHEDEANVANELRAAGLVTGREHGAIVSAAARSRVSD
jgi:hypothetical protein